MDADHEREADALRRSDERLLRAVRAASGPPADPDMARRVADGAWRRGRSMRSGPKLGRRWSRPAYLAAAAAALVAAVVLWPVDGGDSALAVEGDPVLVWKGDDWREENRVDAGRYVYVPHEGTRTLTFRDGSAIEPSPGAVFVAVRTTAPDRTLRFELEIVRGEVQYAGTARHMRVAEIDVDPDPDTDSGQPRVHFRVSRSSGAEHPLPLPRLLTLVGPGEPRIAVDTGSVAVRARPTGELLILGPSQEAAFLPVDDDPGVRRLTRLRAFSAQALGDVLLRGKFPVDATVDSHGTTVVFLGNGGDWSAPTAIEIPAGERARAIAQLNAATFFHQELALGPGSLRTTIEMRIETSPTRHRESEYVLEQDADRYAVYVRPDGSCQLDENGATREFASLDALRTAAPHVADAFGDRLGR